VTQEYPISMVDWTNDGIIDYKTDPNNPDTDSGGTWDGIEVEATSNPLNSSDDFPTDADGDGLIDSEELVYGTNITDRDTDDDELIDGLEVHIYKTNPLDNDTDDDQLFDGAEVFNYKTNPLSKDTDSDNLNDYFELFVSNTNPNNPDSDGDKLPDGLELDDSDGNVTDPLNDDTDGDGLYDGEEDANLNGKVDSINPADWNDGNGPGETDPLIQDTDGGGLFDGTEVWGKFNPLDPNDDNTTDDQDWDGLTDTQEVMIGTNPLDPDTDNDGLVDGKEVNKYHTNPLEEDTDDDNITDGEEIYPGYDGYRTNPLDPDTDNDTLSDWAEIFIHNTDPTLTDTDEDKLSDGIEVYNQYENSTVDWDGDGNLDYTTDPNNPDTDGGGIDDGTEVWNSYDPLNKYDDNLLHDDDGDGLINIDEDINSNGVVDDGETDPKNPDTDGDGLKDGEEVNTYFTDPLDFDTDDDTLPDGLEVDENLGYKTDPLRNDTDGDKLLDNEEIIYGTNPTKKDTDSDGLSDFVELDDSDGFQTDPNDWDSDGDWLPDGWIDRNKNGIKDVTEFEDRNRNGKIDSKNSADWNNGSGPGETDPNKKDSDGGGANDFFEINRTYNPLDPLDDKDLEDADGDGLTDTEENETYGTDWLDTDTDNDGLSDYEEIFKYKTNATNSDSDDDGIGDKEEVEIGSDKYQTNPNSNDTDNDTLLDWDEINKFKTDPTKYDTDGDGKPDWAEVNKTQSRSARSSSSKNGLNSIKSIRSNGNTNATDWDTDGDGLPDGWIDGWGYNISQDRWGLWENLKNGKQERGVKVGDVILAEFEDKSNFNVVDPDETDSLKADTDGGGAWDGDEVIAPTKKDPINNASDDWNILDTDRDRIPDIVENQTSGTDTKHQTKWNISDTDNDGLWDGKNVDINYDGKIDYKGEKVGHNNFGPTNPNSSDSDDDGLLDGEEVNGDYGYKTDPNSNDTDLDGLLDGFDHKNLLGELTMHYPDQEESTNPLKADSDNDGIWDGHNVTINTLFHFGELDFGTNPVDQDTDNDYLSDGEEIMNWKTNPLDDDTDGGSVSDGTELIFRYPPTDPLDPSDDIISDTDHDGIFNHVENKTRYPFSTVNWDGIDGYDYYTNWKNNDTDKDGLLDGEEVLVYHTNPLHNDTDNDTISDYDELNGINGYVTDPLNADTDNDGLTDILEITTYHTDPTLNDTDNGGVNDYIEVMEQFTNPNDPSDDGGEKVPIVETKILIHSVPLNVTKGELFTVKGNLTSIEGDTVWPALVMIKIYLTSNISDDNYELAGSAILKDISGEFIIDCIVPSSVMFGENRVIAFASATLTKMKQYNESWSFNNPYQTTVNSTVFVHSDTILKFINISSSVNKDALIRGEGILTDIGGMPIHEGRVVIYFDEIWKETNRTDEDGKLRYSFVADVPEEEIGEHEIVLFFEGNDYLNPSSANFTIQILSDNTNINFSITPIKNLKVNDNIWISGNVTGLNNEPITSKMNIYFELINSDVRIEKYFIVENGSFIVQMYIYPNEFSAGLYEVYIEFPGSKIYSKDTSNIIELYIQGQVSFSYQEEFTIYRDSGDLLIPVKLLDNLGNPLGGRDISIHYELPARTYSAILTTSINGSIKIPFRSEYDDPLGAVNIQLVYDPPNGSAYAGNTTNMIIFIKSTTNITLYDKPLELIRTEGYLFKGNVIDDQDQPATSQNVMISLGSEKTVITYFSTVTDSFGNFELSVLVPLSFPLGINNIEISTGLSDKYEPDADTYNVILKARPIITIHTNSTIKRGDEYLITISLTEDNGKIPITRATVAVYVNEALDATLTTDQKLGYAYYQNTFDRDLDKTTIRVTYDGFEKEYYIKTGSEITLIPESTEREETDYFGALLFYWPLILGCIVIVIIVIFWSRWRRQHIPEIRAVLSELMDKLETSDKTRRAIFNTYIKLLAILEHYGFIRKESETAREFEDAIQKALPQVSSKNLNSLTNLFEEARYSTHRMGKSHRSKAMKNLKYIRISLEPLEPTAG
jgi:hypothetical protein